MRLPNLDDRGPELVPAVEHDAPPEAADDGGDNESCEDGVENDGGDGHVVLPGGELLMTWVHLRSKALDRRMTAVWRF
jgi:hypothetical protein